MALLFISMVETNFYMFQIHIPFPAIFEFHNFWH
jgi:hypothetical protein